MDTYPHRGGISSPENGRNRAQNRGSEDSKGSEDIFPVFHEGVNDSYRCYHNGCKCKHTCDFQTDSKGEYEKHGALKHPKNPLLYPSGAEIEKYRLTPQDKSWEK